MKIALGVEYNGTNYHGWQKQHTVLTIQEQLENALSKIANHKINVTCAGRTDAGVHSTGQVVHFTTISVRKKNSWVFGVNSYLPNDISVQWAKIVPNFFNARYSAISRRYRYFIYNYKCRSSIFYSQYYCFSKMRLDVNKMKLAGNNLIGEHDFSSFRGRGCQSKTPWRQIIYFNISRQDRLVIIDIEANSFLYRMVRNIVGCLIDIGSSKKKITWIQYLLKNKNRNLGGVTAKASGLYLIFVHYPLVFNLSRNICRKFFVI
ncbi:tRNA pseudouridine synthase A [Buchnera aphidicola (Nipponaphis monzeni)]|uniref:tRNA pseudouridine synthase A n=1 Tax=Buchnera aphidicola (Nipponaphis monzeni) TaxID=2495405 RepID=A0A455T9Z4_9GAMM|nr:tRNA pseudouridine(38-40) synthase TruA [Buchnera aphidicola]BBI01177.1 tRNA pseudouridine synthase A [Buchnera aphidicola (Nipponaphis monzeni)]